jgi:predicted nucleic acid-binding protein
MSCYFYVDPSAWSKRYVIEAGTPLLHQLFDALLGQRPPRLLCSRIGVGELAAVLQRRRNEGTFSASAYNTAYRRLLAESNRIGLHTVYNRYLDESLHYIQAHSVNATDALHLVTALELHSEIAREGHRLILFGADQRLLRAAQAEGLEIFNPETGTEAQLAALLSA